MTSEELEAIPEELEVGSDESDAASLSAPSVVLASFIGTTIGSDYTEPNGSVS